METKIGTKPLHHYLKEYRMVETKIDGDEDRNGSVILIVIDADEVETKIGTKLDRFPLRGTRKWRRRSEQTNPKKSRSGITAWRRRSEPKQLADGQASEGSVETKIGTRRCLSPSTFETRGDENRNSLIEDLVDGPRLKVETKIGRIAQTWLWP